MDIRTLLTQMTLEEKAGLCSGLDFWHTKAVNRLNIPDIMVSDGPHGLRKQEQEGDHVGVNDSIKAVCFPTGSAVASSFDRDLIKTMGEALGEECQAEDVSIILGPAVNIKRSPLCGRNFEYFSEDPYLTSEMAANHIKGVQSKDVGTSLKHYLANNQEYRRMTSDSVIDERTLREIYLAAFEGAVKQGKPWTVMCSYNKINGTYASESYRFLTEVLREEWGFEGFVMSDWGAVNDRVKGLKAGLELEMPSSNGFNDTKIAEAVKNGSLLEEVLDEAVFRILSKVFEYKKMKKADVVFDRDKHHELARTVSAESMVLLKNDGILPLAKQEGIAFIGTFAKNPRYQGGGSSHINSHKTTSALEAVKELLPVTYAQGYDTKEDKTHKELVDEAVAAAKSAKVAVVFAGLPDAFESEGYDRKHMSLPDCQNYLIDQILAVQPNTVIVLHNGSPVEMPWADKVKAILEVYLGGQAVGSATVDVLFGTSNPCGKLAETFPIQLEDNPSYLYYLGEKDKVEYREGVFVGYRYFDKKKAEVLFPFGHGLSYTTYNYSNLTVSSEKITDKDTVTVTVDVTNSGNRAGKEIVQLYVSLKDSSVIRPIKELKGFEKIYLEPGDTKTITFQLDKRSFAYYNTEIQDWHAETGEYDILIGKSSRDIVLSKSLHVESTTVIKTVYTINSTFGDIMKDTRAKDILKPVLDSYSLGMQTEGDDTLGEGTANMMAAMFDNMPLRAILSFSGGNVEEKDLKEALAKLNQIL